MISGFLHESTNGFRAVTTPTGGGGKAVTNLNTAVDWRTLETDSSDCASVGGASNQVVAKRSLFADLPRGAKERADSANVALKGKILSPMIIRARTSRNNAFGFSNINSPQLKVRRSQVIHYLKLPSVGDTGLSPGVTHVVFTFRRDPKVRLIDSDHTLLSPVVHRRQNREVVTCDTTERHDVKELVVAEYSGREWGPL